uniref:Ephrin_rec_like domain-containing protein n=1 Tax=Macrostomum lignano TaxID=282301 RepID=A0A1I8GNU5_9PLAT
GSFSLGNAANCTLCPAGTFSFNPGSSECSKCPAGNYASESGSQKRHDCDLNFALRHRIGMAHCDLCPDSGTTFGTGKCHPKLPMKWDASFDKCERTVDNDVSTYGAINFGSRYGAGGPDKLSYLQYRLDKAATYSLYDCFGADIKYLVIAETESSNYAHNIAEVGVYAYIAE